ncbi:RHS repeat-associated core domain-containing protein [Prosthecobacter fusiformis]|nr:RHS repeat-associated core domain-containing protein [Prosthecobacter fusiformis]
MDFSVDESGSDPVPLTSAYFSAETCDLVGVIGAASYYEDGGCSIEYDEYGEPYEYCGGGGDIYYTGSTSVTGALKAKLDSSLVKKGQASPPSYLPTAGGGGSTTDYAQMPTVLSQSYGLGTQTMLNGTKVALGTLIFEKALDAITAPSISDIKIVPYLATIGPFSGPVEYVRTPGGTGPVLQYKTENLLADLTTLTNGVQIRFYDLSVVSQTKNSTTHRYTTSGDPFAAHIITKVTVGGETGIQISSTENGVTKTHQSFATPNVDGSGARVTIDGDMKTEILDVRPNGAAGERIISTTVTRLLPGGGSVPVSVSENHYELVSWGQALVSSVSDPAGANLETQYFYNASGLLTSEIYPDGSWTSFVRDGNGEVTSTYRPWLDGPANPAAAAAGNSARTSYSISTQTDTMGYTISVTKTTIQSVLGTQVSKSVEIESRGVDPLGSGSVFIVESQSFHGTSSTPSEESTSVHEAVWDYDLQEHVRGRLLHTISPTGIVTTYTEGENGLTSRQTGTLASPEGVNGKSILEETITGEFGVTNQTTKIYSGSSYQTISVRETAYTAPTGYPITETFDGHTIRTLSRPDETTTIEVDAEGITTTRVEDGNGNLIEVSRNGVTTNYTWSSTLAGLPKQTTSKTAGLLTITSYQVTDLAGRLLESCDENGVVTTYAYSSGGRVITEYSPGTGGERRERTTTTYLDGQLKSITGSAVVDQFHNYEVVSGTDPILSKTILETAYFGDGYTLQTGNRSPRWQKTYTDGLGRKLLEERPGPASSTLAAAYHYNEAGQLIKMTQTAMADMLYSYDPDTGEQIMSGYDLDGSGVLELASNEPVSKTTRYYEQAAGEWWEITEQSRLTNDASATEGALTKRRRKFGVGLNSVVETTLPDGTVLTETTAINSLNHTRTVTATSNRSSLSGVQTWINGLLTSSSRLGSIGSVTYGYDDLERQTSVTPTGQTATTTQFVTGTHLPEIVSGPGGSFVYSYYGTSSPWVGQVQTVTDGELAVTNIAYTDRGDTAAVWGTATHPVRYEYNAFGEKWKMHTFRTDPANDTPITAGDVTEWVYEAASGLLEEKRDAANASVIYTHDFGVTGRVVQRAWARGGITTSSYDLAGRLTSVNYNDGVTPNVSYQYLRDGTLNQMTDAAGIHSYAYEGPARQEVTETISGSGLLSGYVMESASGHAGTNGYVEARRGAQVIYHSTRMHAADTGLLQSTTGVGGAWTYSYDSGSGTISEIGFTMTGGTPHVAVHERDTFGRVATIRYQHGDATDAWSSHGILGWSYSYHANSPQRREKTLPYRLAGGSPLPASPPSWSHAYNSRGEVASASRGDAEGDPISGQAWGYAYDAIGNRLTSTQSGHSTGYSANERNQYSSIAYPDSVEISGLTTQGVTRVAVNGQPATGRPPENGEPDGFSQWLSVPNAQQPKWLTVKVEASRPGEPPENAPLEMLRQGKLWVPSSQTSPAYDADGNLLFDGRWRYTWDLENRLVAVETDQAVALLPNAPARMRLEFAYDGNGRRVSKVVKRWQTGAEQWLTVGWWKFLHEGWNLVAELDALRGEAVERAYIWGKDLSGTMSGAGGVGGLLGLYDGRTGKVYSVCIEVNGNVMGLIDSTTGDLAARYDYNAFGKKITAVGPAAAVCPMGFSTKYKDVETGLVYYGYRYYAPEMGRWISRDPIEENGGINLYGMCGNDPVNGVDVLGLNMWQLNVVGSNPARDRTTGSSGAPVSGQHVAAMAAATEFFPMWSAQDGSEINAPKYLLDGDPSQDEAWVLLVAKTSRGRYRHGPGFPPPNGLRFGESRNPWSDRNSDQNWPAYLRNNVKIKMKDGGEIVVEQNPGEVWNVPSEGAANGLGSALAAQITYTQKRIEGGWELELTYSVSGGWSSEGVVNHNGSGFFPPSESGSPGLEQFIVGGGRVNDDMRHHPRSRPRDPQTGQGAPIRVKLKIRSYCGPKKPAN